MIIKLDATDLFRLLCTGLSMDLDPTQVEIEVEPFSVAIKDLSMEGLLQIQEHITPPEEVIESAKADSTHGVNDDNIALTMSELLQRNAEVARQRRYSLPEQRPLGANEFDEPPEISEYELNNSVSGRGGLL